MKTLLGDDVHATLQEILHVHQQCAEREARFIRRERHQQIDVTGIIGIAPRHGPEYAHVGNTVAFGERKNPGAVLFDHRVHCYQMSALLPNPYSLPIQRLMSRVR